MCDDLLGFSILLPCSRLPWILMPIEKTVERTLAQSEVLWILIRRVTRSNWRVLGFATKLGWGIHFTFHQRPIHSCNQFVRYDVITIFTSTISHVSISLGGICPHTTNSAVPYLTRSINWGGRKTSKIRLLFRAWHSCCRGRRRSWRWKEKYISPPQCSIFASGAQLQPTVPSLTTNASNPIGRNTP